MFFLIIDMKINFFMAVATLVVSAAAVVGVKAYNYYSMPELMRANLEALTQNDIDEIVVQIYAYQEHITVVLHGDQYVLAGSVCPKIFELGGSYTCTHNTVEREFDCCNYLSSPTNGCEVYPTACSAILKEKYGINI